MRYRPDLDGLRALAVLAVFVFHVGYFFASGGWLGVDVFFVLSGYLITTLLVREREKTGRISLRRFYARRLLRLYPALLLMILLFVPFYGVLGAGGTLIGYVQISVVAATYTQDLFAGLGIIGHFGHTWSLAVEEQFYLVWPLVLLLVLRFRRDPMKWAIGGAVSCWIITAIYALPATVTDTAKGWYYFPWCRFSQLLAGCVLALMIARGMRAPRWLKHTAGGVAAFVGVGVLMVVVGPVLWHQYPQFAWQQPVAAVLVCALLWHLAETPTGPLGRALGVAPLRWLGRRSYGFYLFHGPVYSLVATIPGLNRHEITLLSLLAILVLSALSYRFVEMPFLRLKARFQTLPAEDSPGAHPDNSEQASARLDVKS